MNKNRNYLMTASLVLAIVAAVASPRAMADPLEEIKVSASIDLNEKDGKILVSKKNIYRITVSDPAICKAAIISPREISLLANRAGTTNVALWMEGDTVPTKLAIKVHQKKKKRRR